MKILYLKTDIHFTPLKVGGSISHMLGILQGFKQCCSSVIVASSVDHEQLNQWCDKKYSLKMPRLLACLRWKINCILSSFFFLPVVLYLIYKYNPDYIYQRYSPFNFTGIFAQYLTSTSLILEYNGSEVWTDEAWLKRSKNKKFLIGFMQWCEKKILLLATYRSVVSSVLKDQLKEQYNIAHNTCVTPNGVNTKLFIPTTYLGCKKKDSFLIGFSSSFGPWHGINIIHYLINQFAEHQLPYHLRLLGTGRLYNELFNATRHAQDYVTFEGSVAHHKVPSYLSSCDAFICPTQPNKDGTPFFGAPTKLFEYASLAKPIITSNIAQTNSLLPGLFYSDECCIDQPLTIDNQAGICVDPTNKKGFLKACLVLKSLSDEQRNHMGNNGRNHMIKHYEWSTITRRLINSLEG